MRNVWKHVVFMAGKKQKNILLSNDGRFFMGVLKIGTNFSDTDIIENCLAMHALVLNREVRRAQEFLYKNLVRATGSETLHRSTWPKYKKPAREQVAK